MTYNVFILSDYHSCKMFEWNNSNKIPLITTGKTFLKVDEQFVLVKTVYWNLLRFHRNKVHNKKETQGDNLSVR